jgi:mannose-6-phosphate isomerase
VPVPAVFAVDGVERDYAWGSTTAIQRLLGREPDGRPCAELWFGAHADDPAHVPVLGATLDTVIEADPLGLLGQRVVDRFGPRLPFLLKVLAADKALSIQVHPTLDQARAGYAADNAAGLAPDAPRRNYRDANHKPELLCALTPFEALCGFRPVADTVRLLDALRLDGLRPVRDLLADPGAGLRAAVAYLLTLADPAPLVTAVLGAAATVEPPSEWHGAARAVLLAGADLPDDIGVVLALLLNHVRLRPGEAIYLAAGNVHAYLRGTGVEIMANSDNVLRCGLTPKHVDVAELLKVADFSELTRPRRRPDRADVRGTDFGAPVPDFRLRVADLDGYREPGRADGSCATDTAGLPQLVLCTSGRVTVDVGASSVELTPGRAAFVPAGETAVSLTGAGRTFLATVGG